MSAFLIHEDEDLDTNYDDNNNNSNNNNNNNNNKPRSSSPKGKKKRQKKKDEEEMTDEKRQEIQEKVKVTIAKTVAEIVDFRINEWNKSNLEDNDDEDLKLKASKEFIFGLTELIYDTSVVLGNDLEQFKKHRGKKTVEVKDFMLFCRRNKDLKQKMIDFHNHCNAKNY
eukprot:61029_1